MARSGKSTGQFDNVVIDSPPTVVVADSVLLATMMDATIMVVRSKVTSRESVVKGLARLRQGRVKVTGAVLNAVSPRAGYYGQYAYYTSDDNDEISPDPATPSAESPALLPERATHGKRAG